MDDFRQMREFIVATEHLIEQDDVETPTPLAEAIQPDVSLIEDLERIVFKLRAFMESEGGDLALGVEMGMQRAADMIERVIKRHAGE